MNSLHFVYLAFGLWLVQQVNDLVNSFINRAFVPKMFWLSAATSFLSGLALFWAFVNFIGSTVEVVNEIIDTLNPIANALH